MKVRIACYLVMILLLCAGASDLQGQKHFSIGGGISTQFFMNPRPIGPLRSRGNAGVIGNSLDLHIRIPCGQFSITPTVEFLGFLMKPGRQYYFNMENPEINDLARPTSLQLPATSPAPLYVFGPTYSKRQAVSQFGQISMGAFLTYTVEEDFGVGTGLFVQMRNNAIWEDKLRDAYAYSHTIGQNDFYAYQYSYYSGPEYHFLRTWDLAIPLILHFEDQQHNFVKGYSAILWWGYGDRYIAFRYTMGLYSKHWHLKRPITQQSTPRDP